MRITRSQRASRRVLPLLAGLLVLPVLGLPHAQATPPSATRERQIAGHSCTGRDLADRDRLTFSNSAWVSGGTTSNVTDVNCGLTYDEELSVESIQLTFANVRLWNQDSSAIPCELYTWTGDGQSSRWRSESSSATSGAVTVVFPNSDIDWVNGDGSSSYNPTGHALMACDLRKNDRLYNISLGFKDE